MHLYIMTRGIKHEVDRFINDLQAQYYPYRVGKKKHYVQLGVRPIQLWEIVTPKESMPEVMATIGIDGKNKYRFSPQRTMLRKLLHCKKLPKLDPKTLKRIVYKDNVGVYPIGVKADEETETHEVL